MGAELSKAQWQGPSISSVTVPWIVLVQECGWTMKHRRMVILVFILMQDVFETVAILSTCPYAHTTKISI